MDTLTLIIDGMNKEEVRFFKLYSSRVKSNKQRKDLLLFDNLRKKSANFDEEKFIETIYKGEGRNAYYRLKNRLIEDLNKSLLIQHFDKEDNMYLLHLISLSRFYVNRNNHKVAFHLIKKAEAKAKELEDFEFLDIIYGIFIKLSYQIISINPENYIEKRKQNREQLNSLSEIDDIMAVVSYRIITTQNLSSGDNQIFSLLEKTVNDFTQNESLKKNSRFRFRIYRAISHILLKKHDYKILEEYLLNTYKEFNKEKLFHKSNHDIRLEMLTFIVNTLFINKKLDLSLKWAEILREAMEEYDRMLYEKYIYFYYNSLVINYSETDKDKAINILEDLRDNNSFKDRSYEGFIYINLAVLGFDKGNYRNAIKNLNKAYTCNPYINSDKSTQLKVIMAELIIRYEMSDFEYFEYRIGQVKKDFKEQLANEENTRERKLIDILSAMNTSDNIKKDKKLQEKIKNFVDGKVVPRSEAEVIKYNDWLRSKIN